MRLICIPRGQDICGVLILVLVSLALGIYARGGWESAPRSGNTLMHPVFSLAEFRTLVESRHAPILDARSREDYRRGHVPGAISLPVADFDMEYPRVISKISSQKGELVIVYCSNMWCGLADDLQKKLIDRGFQHVGRFPNGWDAWQSAQLQKETSP